MYEIEKYFEYDSAEESLKAWKERVDGFHTKLQAELCEMFFSYWPEMEVNRELIVQELWELAGHSCHDAYFSLLLATEYLHKGLPVLGDQSLPAARSRDKEEKELEELFDKFPILNTEQFIQSYWEDFELGIKVDNFYFQTHRKIKEALVEFYFENINRLYGDQLRYLDCQLYYMSSFPFSEGSLKLKFQTEADKDQSQQPAGELDKPSISFNPLNL
jgi:hypothetical protein